MTNRFPVKSSCCSHHLLVTDYRRGATRGRLQLSHRLSFYLCLGFFMLFHLLCLKCVRAIISLGGISSTFSHGVSFVSPLDILHHRHHVGTAAHVVLCSWTRTSDLPFTPIDSPHISSLKCDQQDRRTTNQPRLAPCMKEFHHSRHCLSFQEWFPNRKSSHALESTRIHAHTPS